MANGGIGFWRECISAPSGLASSKRVALLMAAAALSIAVVVLAAAACLGHSVSGEMLAASGSLAGLSGYGYVNKREGST